MLYAWLNTILSPEAVLLLVSTKNLDLWACPTPEVCHSDRLKIQNENFLCPENHILPETAILGTDQKIKCEFLNSPGISRMQ